MSNIELTVTIDGVAKTYRPKGMILSMCVEGSGNAEHADAPAEQAEQGEQGENKFITGLYMSSGQMKYRGYAAVSIVRAWSEDEDIIPFLMDADRHGISLNRPPDRSVRMVMDEGASE